MDAISAQAIPRLSDFVSQEISNTSWAFAKLGVCDRPLFDSLAAAARSLSSSLQEQDISNTVWAFAKSGFKNLPLLAAISAAALNTCSDLRPQDLSNIAWSVATLEFVNAPLLAAISAAARAKITECCSRDFANTAWSFSPLSYPDQPLLASISSSAIPRINELELQPIAVLVDADLPCSGALMQQLQRAIASYLVCVPRRFADWQTGCYANLLYELQVDNFGHVGNKIIFEAWRIPAPPLGWQQLAERHVKQHAEAHERLLEPGTVHKRVFCYAEYQVEGLGAVYPYRDRLLRENGLQRGQQRPSRQRWITEFMLPINHLVDRSLCAEFVLLEDLAERLAATAVAGPAGGSLGGGGSGGSPCSGSGGSLCGGGASAVAVQVWVSGSSCLSCVAAFRQFQLLFPSVTLEVACQHDEQRSPGGRAPPPPACTAPPFPLRLPLPC